jgi:hypothetical protein
MLTLTWLEQGAKESATTPPCLLLKDLRRWIWQTKSSAGIIINIQPQQEKNVGIQLKLDQSFIFGPRSTNRSTSQQAAVEVDKKKKNSILKLPT